MTDIVPVKLKGKLKELVDTLVSTGVYGSKSEVIRSGIRKVGEEHGLTTQFQYYTSPIQTFTYLLIV